VPNFITKETLRVTKASQETDEAFFVMARHEGILLSLPGGTTKQSYDS
jgi:hypothetical protein